MEKGGQVSTGLGSELSGLAGQNRSSQDWRAVSGTVRIGLPFKDLTPACVRSGRPYVST